MKGLFVSYEIAKQLREKGFDEACLAYWNISEKKIHIVPQDMYDSPIFTLAPLYQQVVDWFREKHKIIIFVNRDWNDGKIIGYESTIDYSEGFIVCGTFKDYYKSLTKAIEESLKLI